MNAHFRDSADRMDPLVELDFLFVNGNMGNQRPARSANNPPMAGRLLEITPITKNNVMRLREASAQQFTQRLIHLRINIRIRYVFRRHLAATFRGCVRRC
ncbi:MAG: hypothetical protein M5U15_09030 [Kiritimatiellae bacterium]|nr:hypothetical protein [Kiritimatiellia bacterium]